MSVDLDDLEKVLAQKNRRTRARASEKVGRDLTYQLFCLVVQVKLACPKGCYTLVVLTSCRK
jgi:tetrahydromethanopterin S-methyltransferase subunit G